jgi:hypothetical protein
VVADVRFELSQGLIREANGNQPNIAWRISGGDFEQPGAKRDSNSLLLFLGLQGKHNAQSHNCCDQRERISYDK